VSDTTAIGHGVEMRQLFPWECVGSAAILAAPTGTRLVIPLPVSLWGRGRVSFVLEISYVRTQQFSLVRMMCRLSAHLSPRPSPERGGEHRLCTPITPPSLSGKGGGGLGVTSIGDMLTRLNGYCDT